MILFAARRAEHPLISPNALPIRVGASVYPRESTPMNFDQEWNAGELGCGDLVLELRRRVREAPGQVFKVIALDLGAPEDIPAWCGMTGHELLAHDLDSHAYFIRAKS